MCTVKSKIIVYYVHMKVFSAAFFMICGGLPSWLNFFTSEIIKYHYFAEKEQINEIEYGLIKSY